MQTFIRSLLIALVAFTLPAFGAGFYSVHSSNGVEVWAVGNGGTVFRSIDGGANWGSFTQGSAALRAVCTMGSNTWIAGDNGFCYSSSDGGASWGSQMLAGGATLRAIAFPAAQTGWVAGNAGTILKTSNGGASWVPQVSGVSQQLNAIAMVDAQTGYVAGASGTLLKTTNGGATWTNSAQAGWTKEILSVSASGLSVYAAGVDGFCSKSTNGGTSWTSLDFTTDTKVDVNGVCAVTPTEAYFVGGGGFIRTTADAGATYNYGTHQLHAKLNAVFFYSRTDGWACGEKNNVILRTTDGGLTWQLPQGTTVNYLWVQKFSAGSIGNTFCVNPKNKEIIYVVMGATVYMSGDRGETWSSIATIAGGGSTWSFYVSPKDTNIWIAATSGTGGKGVRRTTNRGSTWTTPILRNFTSYGMPLEEDPDHPDTVIFAAEGTGSGPDGVLYKSTNFGATWDTLAQTSFRSPCDIVIVPGNTNLWYVGDGTTGTGAAQMWRSTNYGLNWTSIYSSVSSEIPMIAVSRLRNSYGFATAWGSTSVTKSTNSGLTWTNIAPTGSTWGTDIAKDDPNVVMYGTYGGSTTYLSTNAGTSFTSTGLTGSNSGMLAYDRATFLAHQAGNGVWKYNITYTVPVSSAQIIGVTYPNGGETWGIGSTRTITWGSLGLSGTIKIELSRNGGSIYETLFASTTNDGSEPWVVTGPLTANALVRVSSVSNPSVVDVSNGTFIINQVFSLLTRLTIRDNGGEKDSMEFGTVGGATDGIDVVYGEYELPPLPPAGVFDIRWSIAGTQGTRRDVRDTLGGSRQQIIYTGKMQPGGGGYPLVVKWNRPELPEGTFTLRDGPAGFFFSVNMKLQDSVVISDEAVQQFQLVYDARNAVYAPVQQNWNILSLPLTVDDRSKSAVFPTSVSNAFAFTPTGYASRDTLEYGTGYWLKFPSAQTITVTGETIPVDTIDVFQGWNIIGSITTPVPVGSIVQIPGSIVASQYFGYSSSGYLPASTISPMQGYWVKVNQNGKLVLSGSSFRVQKSSSNRFK